MHKNPNQAKTSWQNKIKQTLNNGNNFSCVQKLLRGWKWFVLRFGAFCAINLFWKKNINSLEIVLITSNTILLACTPINPPIENLFVRTDFYLWSSVRISSFLWESFLIFFICENLFLLWESFRITVICVNLCLYENKQVCESHHLKQIFYHQNTIIIFCWFRMFQVCVFYFGFFSFYVS